MLFSPSIQTHRRPPCALLVGLKKVTQTRVFYHECSCRMFLLSAHSNQQLFTWAPTCFCPKFVCVFTPPSVHHSIFFLPLSPSRSKLIYLVLIHLYEWYFSNPNLVSGDSIWTMDYTPRVRGRQSPSPRRWICRVPKSTLHVNITWGRGSQSTFPQGWICMVPNSSFTCKHYPRKRKSVTFSSGMDIQDPKLNVYM